MGDSGENAGGGTPHSERRTSARLALEMWVEEITGGNLVFRRAGNLSRGGLYLDQTIPLPLRSIVRLKFTLPGDDRPMMLSGEIVSVSAKETLGMGVKFVDMDPETQSRIDAYLDRALTPISGVPT